MQGDMRGEQLTRHVVDYEAILSGRRGGAERCELLRGPKDDKRDRAVRRG